MVLRSLSVTVISRGSVSPRMVPLDGDRAGVVDAAEVVGQPVLEDAAGVDGGGDQLALEHQLALDDAGALRDGERGHPEPHRQLDHHEAVAGGFLKVCRDEACRCSSSRRGAWRRPCRLGSCRSLPPAVAGTMAFISVSSDESVGSEFDRTAPGTSPPLLSTRGDGLLVDVPLHVDVEVRHGVLVGDLDGWLAGADRGGEVGQARPFCARARRGWRTPWL